MLKKFKTDFDEKKKNFIKQKKAMSKSQKRKLDKKERYLRRKHFDNYLGNQDPSLKNPSNLFQMDNFEKTLMSLQTTSEQKANQSLAQLKTKGGLTSKL